MKNLLVGISIGIFSMTLGGSLALSIYFKRILNLNKSYTARLSLLLKETKYVGDKLYKEIMEGMEEQC